ncbi:isoprenylcysteine carboxyl methyltransferase family protein [Streptococcus merionis]|uniref:Isoprenylcysteine carboxyl methyltransferase n=1 Tax=Streptococcus merionis TaxID=400065 RepID=A0A239SRG9_9STRE|nr:isoprenylcysteine carboxyl methyltransferase family protein [Streptococcus merionis]SNU87849.1 isoprenylcysteine carboxyl methyltransferase [Streptococcus merionis]
MIIAIVLLVFGLRLFFLKRSIRNEKRILQNGGREYGAQNTKYITILHILFYLGCFSEALVHQTSMDFLSMFGLALLVASMVALCTVIHLLGDIWTVKLMILKDHKFVDHWLFRTIKHPNYYLNVIPELLGLALLCHAKWTFLALCPFYLVVLYRRIKEEERLIRDIIIPNGIKS